jgi:D-lactate dehydrogenase (cytochrome)
MRHSIWSQVLTVPFIATLKLAPLLPNSVAVSSFPNIQAAADTVAEVVQNGVAVQCIEILDDLMMKAINKAESTNKHARQWPEQPSLFFKFAGSPEQIKLDMKRTSEIVKRNSGTKLLTATTEAEKEDLWRARKVALWSALAYVPGSRCWTTDVCVPMSQFPTLVAETKADLDSLGVIAPIVGHAGDGVSDACS